MKRFLCGLVALGLLVAGAAQAEAQPSYVFSPLNVPGSIDTAPFGINNAGQIVGLYTDARQFGHGFLLSGGIYTTLDPPRSVETLAQGINDAGQIVGFYYTNPLGGPPAGFLLSAGNYTTLTPPGSTYTVVSGINNSGQIVGVYEDALGHAHSFLLSGGSYTTLDVPGSTMTAAQGINNIGQIVGEYVDASGARHGFLLSGGIYTTLNLPGVPSGINDADQIVGTSDDYTYGFVLSDGVLTTLRAPGSIITEAFGINDAGLIVGHARGGFLASPVPEPATLLLVGIGTLGLLARAWRRRNIS